MTGRLTLPGVLAAITLVAAACTSDGHSREAAPSLSSCNASAPSGETMLETMTSGGRTVNVRLPQLPGWARRDSPPPTLGEGSRLDSSGGWVVAVPDIDFASTATTFTLPKPTPFFPTPKPPDPDGVAIDDFRHGTVCGYEAVLKRQHPTSVVSQNPYLRGQLIINCGCGPGTPVTITVALTTGERKAPLDTRSKRVTDPPPYPSRFESDIATILGNVQVDWTTA